VRKFDKTAGVRCFADHRRWKTNAVVTLGLFFLPTLVRADSATPSQVIGNLQKTFTAVLHDAAKLGYEGRRAKLAPEIHSAFDLEFMAHAVLGREWDQLDEKQRARWVETFGNFTIANYAARLDHWSGQTFEIIGVEKGENDTEFVNTKVIDPAAENVDLSYRMRKVGDEWKVVDVYAKSAVSELALRRSEYAAVLKKEGFDALISTVERKITDLAAGKGTQ
jgi:phospholipid transport system substrate-binding protein